VNLVEAGDVAAGASKQRSRCGHGYKQQTSASNRNSKEFASHSRVMTRTCLLSSLQGTNQTQATLSLVGYVPGSLLRLHELASVTAPARPRAPSAFAALLVSYDHETLQCAALGPSAICPCRKLRRLACFVSTFYSIPACNAVVASTLRGT
jgi:hypothetical protein